MTSVGTMQEKPLDDEDKSVQTEESTEIVGVEERGDMSLDIQGVNVNYTINGGKIISIIPDLDETSLIITIETTTDGELIITLPKDVIDGIFFVLVDGEETIYTEEVNDNSSTLIIPFYNGTEEIEIIGTFVIPEFGTIVVLVLAIAIITIITITTKSRLSIVSKF
jgi:predicted secreted protein with PEFG-CTERM motif